MNTLITTRPSPNASPPWTFPAITRIVTDGVTLLAAHLPGRPMVALHVVADAGASAEPAGRWGVAGLTASALLKGARGLDEDALAIAFESVGASPTGASGFDHATFSLSTPAGLLADAAALVADVVRRPTLDPTELADVRQQALDGLAAAEANAAHVCGRSARRGFFEGGNRWSVAAGGTIETLGALDAGTIRDFHADRWARSELTIVLAGDLDGVELETVAAAFSVTDARGVPAGIAEPQPTGGGVRIVLADMPGAVQSVINLIAPGPAYAIADAAPLHVAQAVVVAAFGARLNQKLREELGWTYGASGSFQRHRDGGMFLFSTQVRNEVTAGTITETLALLRASVLDAPLTDAEVEQARDNAVSKFAVAYDGAGAVAGALVNRASHGLPDDERDVMLANLKAVTTEQANAAWRTRLDLDDVVIAVAGDAAEVRESLVATGVPVIGG